MFPSLVETSQRDGLWWKVTTGSAVDGGRNRVSLAGVDVERKTEKVPPSCPKFRHFGAWIEKTNSITYFVWEIVWLC